MTVGIPRSLNFPFSGLGMDTRFTGAGRYFPDRIALVSSPGCAWMYDRSSSVVIPSTPGAPLLASTRSSASAKFLWLSIASSVISVKADWSCAVLSISITAVAPFHAPLAIPWLPGRGQVSLSFLRLATLCLRHRTPIDSALRQVLPCLLWLLLTTHGKLYSVCLVGRTSVSPPRVRTCSFPPCACCIYTSDSV